jgi:hypothetical protein
MCAQHRERKRKTRNVVFFLRILGGWLVNVDKLLDQRVQEYPPAPPSVTHKKHTCTVTPNPYLPKRVHWPTYLNNKYVVLTQKTFWTMGLDVGLYMSFKFHYYGPYMLNMVSK